jgi:hypothetical protein
MPSLNGAAGALPVTERVVLSCPPTTKTIANSKRVANNTTLETNFPFIIFSSSYFYMMGFLGRKIHAKKTGRPALLAQIKFFI